MASIVYKDERMTDIRQQIKNAASALALMRKPKNVSKEWYDKQRHDVIGALNLAESRLTDVQMYSRASDI